MLNLASIDSDAKVASTFRCTLNRHLASVLTSMFVDAILASVEC